MTTPRDLAEAEAQTFAKIALTRADLEARAPLESMWRHRKSGWDCFVVGHCRIGRAGQPAVLCEEMTETGPQMPIALAGPWFLAKFERVEFE